MGLLSPSARADDASAADDGKKAFSAGVILLKDPDGAKYEEALAQFKKAYDLLKSWKVLGNVALCALKLERDGEALEAYEKYLAAGGAEIDAEERAQVDRDLSALRAQLVKVHLDLPSRATRVTDERSTAQGGRIVNEYEASGASIELGMHP